MMNADPRRAQRAQPGHERLSRLGHAARSELWGLHPRLLLATLLAAALPPFVGSRLRTAALRAAGFRIGRGSVFWGGATFTGRGDIYSRLRVGADCVFNLGCVFDLEATITVGDRVSVGHEVMLLTSSHRLGGHERRASYELLRRPITIGDGAWVGARAVLLPGVTIGAGAVVAAGALVSRDVPPDCLAAGVPARVLRHLDEGPGAPGPAEAVAEGTQSTPTA